jgi:hypothetical protein
LLIFIAWFRGWVGKFPEGILVSLKLAICATPL